MVGYSEQQQNQVWFFFTDPEKKRNIEQFELKQKSALAPG